MYYTEDALAHVESSGGRLAMGCDLAAALGRATGNDATLFGINTPLPASEQFTFGLFPGRQFAIGEMIRQENWQIRQARTTHSVLGCRLDNEWGYLFGVNEHRVAAGFSAWTSRLPTSQNRAVTAQSMAAPDLIRLVLERCASARQACDMLTNFISRYGQRMLAVTRENPQDHIFLLVDGDEAFVVEAADRYWAMLEVGTVRAVGEVGLIRQDWDRISPGLADYAIGQGWWQADGSKLDFAGSVSDDPVGPSSALRRWGRATFLLEDQSGHIDVPFFRRLLSDHYEGTRFEADPLLNLPGPVPLCRHAAQTDELETACSFYAQWNGGDTGIPVGWLAFGPPCLGVYLPILPVAGSHPVSPAAEKTPYHSNRMAPLLRKLHQSIGLDADRWQHVRDRMTLLQERFDEDVDEFQQANAQEAAIDCHERNRVVGTMMENHLEQLERALKELLEPIETTERSAAVR